VSLTMFPFWFPQMPFAVVFLILSVLGSTLRITLMWVAFACLCIVVTFMRLGIAVVPPWEPGARRSERQLVSSPGAPDRRDGDL
jgi:hypothetical protein